MMVSRNGVQLGYSVVARSFFEVFQRYSKVGCCRTFSAQSQKRIKPLEHPNPPDPHQFSYFEIFEDEIRAVPSDSNCSSVRPLPPPPPRTRVWSDLNYVPDPDTPLSKSVRAIMRAQTHGVVILTTAHRGPTAQPRESQIQNFRGMTISSFTTVSLSPSPIVSFNIHAKSSTLAALRESKEFLIHFLADTEAAAALAREFSKGGGGRHWFNTAPPCGPEGFGAFSTWAKRYGAVVLPRLQEKAVEWVLKCKVWSGQDPESIFDVPAQQGIVNLGDHCVVFGSVEKVWRKPGTATQGLGYANGEYLTGSHRLSESKPIGSQTKRDLRHAKVEAPAKLKEDKPQKRKARFMDKQALEIKRQQVEIRRKEAAEIRRKNSARAQPPLAQTITRLQEREDTLEESGTDSDINDAVAARDRLAVTIAKLEGLRDRTDKRIKIREKQQSKLLGVMRKLKLPDVVTISGLDDKERSPDIALDMDADVEKPTAGQGVAKEAYENVDLGAKDGGEVMAEHGEKEKAA